MSLCLSNDDLYELTGYKRPAEQARWLRAQGYYVECNARGVPRITHTQVDEKRRLNPSAAPISKPASSEPNVVAFRTKLNLRP